MVEKFVRKAASTLKQVILKEFDREKVWGKAVKKSIAHGDSVIVFKKNDFLDFVRDYRIIDDGIN